MGRKGGLVSLNRSISFFKQKWHDSWVAFSRYLNYNYLKEKYTNELPF